MMSKILKVLVQCLIGLICMISFGYLLWFCYDHSSKEVVNAFLQAAMMCIGTLVLILFLIGALGWVFHSENDPGGPGL